MSKSIQTLRPLVPCLQIASKMDPADKSTIESAVDDAISWLDTNQLAEVRVCLQWRCPVSAHDIACDCRQLPLPCCCGLQCIRLQPRC